MNKRLTENELINEQYSLLYYKLVENYRLRNFYNEIIDSIVKNDDCELKLMLEHEFSHFLTSYFENKKSDIIDESFIESYDCLRKVSNKIKVNNLFYCLTEQQVRIEQFSTFIRDYINDYNTKEHFLSSSAKFDDIIVKGNVYTDWILFKDIVQELYVDIQKERYEFLLCLCCLLNDANLIKTEPYINRRDMDVYLKDDITIKDIVNSMYRQIYNNLFEYQHSLNKEVFTVMSEVNRNKINYGR